jgi:hypothetical protein
VRDIVGTQSSGQNYRNAQELDDASADAPVVGPP